MTSSSVVMGGVTYPFSYSYDLAGDLLTDCDPAGLLQGTGKYTRHVKLKPEGATNTAAISRLIEDAYLDIEDRVHR